VRRAIPIGLAFALTVGFLLATFADEPAKMIVKKESFDQDPDWDGVRNRIKLPVVRKQQNFGYQNSNNAGGKPGEIGGVVWRSLTPAYYGKTIGPLTMDDPFSASGTVAVKAAKTKFGYQTGSTIFIGFFNHREQGWRPINFIGFRLETHTDTEAKKIESRPGVELTYGTSKWTAGGAHVNTTGEEQERNVKELDQEAMRRVPPDGSKHKWELRYDPKGGGGFGEFTLVFDGVTSRCRIPQKHREQGGTFDRFGIFNNQLPGQEMEAYFDDITVNGEFDDFSTDPKWDEKGNRGLVEDTREYGSNDFGFSPTHFAGSKPGELGGRFFSVDPFEEQFQGYYGDRIGPLNFSHQLTARGKFTTKEFSVDSTFGLGWFNSKKQGYPIENFVGVYFDSLSSVGRIVTPLYGTSKGSKRQSGPYVQFYPDGRVYEWTLEYDPAASNGRGAIAFTLNGERISMPLAEGDKAIGATFDRFGVLNMHWANSKHCVVYLDDVEYTAGVKE
jgi:hypothetical protein